MIQVLTIGFDTPQRTLNTVKRFFKETDVEGLNYTYTVVDARYPNPDQAGNSLTLFFSLMQENLSRSFPVDIGYLLLDRNAGQDGNYDTLSKICSYGDEDVICFYDTDVSHNKRHWLKDMNLVLSDPLVGFITTNCGVTDDALSHQGERKCINSVHVRELCWPGGWSTSSWKGYVFRKGLNKTHEYYGGTEGTILNLVRSTGLKGYMLCDHDDVRCLEGMDVIYQQWKAHVIGTPGRQISFEDYIKKHG